MPEQPRWIEHFVFAAAVSLSLSLTLASPAQAGRAHVHGVMHLDIALDGPLLQVELRAPQDSLVGHERAPRTAAERQAAAAALAVLRDAPSWLRPDPAAGCVAGPVALQPGRLEPAAATAPGAAGDHVDVAATVQWQCATPAALRGADVLLLARFARTERIDVQLAGASGPAHQTLRRASARVRLQR